MKLQALNLNLMTMLFNDKSSRRQPKLSRKSGHACSCGGRKQGDDDDSLVVVDTINSRWCQNGNIMIYRGESNITWDSEPALTFIFWRCGGSPSKLEMKTGREGWEQSRLQLFFHLFHLPPIFSTFFLPSSFYPAAIIMKVREKLDGREMGGASRHVTR